jgi:hypothetical protein
MKTIIIPFSGFYGSLHSSLLDDAETQLFSDDQGTVHDTLQERFYRACDYRHVHTQYAKAYAQAFAEKLELPLTFESLQSPREYNFTTDRIFCNIDDETISKVLVMHLQLRVSPMWRLTCAHAPRDKQAELNQGEFND